MKCKNCGTSINVGVRTCPVCGAEIHYRGKTEFYEKAAESRLHLRDFVSGTFQKHEKGAGAKRQLLFNGKLIM